jgi:plasmid stabilization system protein ParE
MSVEIRGYVRGLPPQLKRKLRATFDAVLANPLLGKPLQGALLGLRSVRVGRFKVLYRPVDDAIQVVAVGPRRTIYEDAERLARRASPPSD